MFRILNILLHFFFIWLLGGNLFRFGYISWVPDKVLFLFCIIFFNGYWVKLLLAVWLL